MTYEQAVEAANKAAIEATDKIMASDDSGVVKYDKLDALRWVVVKTHPDRGSADVLQYVDNAASDALNGYEEE